MLPLHKPAYTLHSHSLLHVTMALSLSIFLKKFNLKAMLYRDCPNCNSKVIYVGEHLSNHQFRTLHIFLILNSENSPYFYREHANCTSKVIYVGENLPNHQFRILHIFLILNYENSSSICSSSDES